MVTHEHVVAEHWASAIINGDYSGLTTEECATLRIWLNVNAVGVGHWDGFSEEDAQGFTTDEISGKRTTCYTVRRVVLG